MTIKYDFPVTDDYKLRSNEELLDGNIVRRTIHNVDHMNIGQHSFTYFLKTGYTKIDHPYYSFTVSHTVSHRDVMNVRIYND